MKKIINLFIFFLIHGTVFSQQKLRDGIYLIDQSVNNPAVYQPNRAVIQFNPFFAEEDPEAYEPLVIVTDNYFFFELAEQPVIQNQAGKNKTLLVQLTGNATEKLKTFIAKNLMKNIVVVVGGEALAVYKPVQPLTSGLVAITKCNGDACKQIYKALKSAVKS
jgi:hypothetical protein